MKRRIQISAEVPDGATDEEVAAYVAEAIEYWGGQFHPQNPLFSGVAARSITIRGEKYQSH